MKLFFCFVLLFFLGGRLFGCLFGGFYRGEEGQREGGRFSLDVTGISPVGNSGSFPREKSQVTGLSYSDC